MRFVQSGAIVLSCVLGFAGDAHAREVATANHIRSFVGAMTAPRGAPPAYAIVVVQGDRTTMLLHGRAGWPDECCAAGPDSRFYIASITKSYVALLAARLDDAGILDLDATISDLWPELRMSNVPPGERITLRQLLSHSSRLDNSAVGFRTANFGDMEEAAFIAGVASSTEWLEPGFHYNNFNYLLYAQILEHVTGRDWRDWLRTELLQPLGLNETHSRTSSLNMSDVVPGHQLGGDGWLTLPPKRDAVMHPAGGLYLSPRDAAAWLRANLRRRRFNAATYAAQRQINIAVDIDITGWHCRGFALGLMVCDAGGVDIYSHTGAFAGWRTIMTFAPEIDAGIFIIAAADTGVDDWIFTLAAQIYDILRSRGPDAATTSALVDAFSRTAETARTERSEAISASASQIASRSWTPDPATLAPYAGRYVNPAIGLIDITPVGGELALTAGVYRARLVPVSLGRFLAFDYGALPEEIEISGGELSWGDNRFHRAE